MSVNRYRLLQPRANDLTISLPIKIDFDILGHQDVIDNYGEDVLSNSINGLVDYEIVRFTHKGLREGFPDPSKTSTPTPTPTITPSSTITPTPSSTLTPTPTKTTTVTPTNTSTPTVTPTNTPTNTPTSSITPSTTITPTITPTNTTTPTPTPTVTPTQFNYYSSNNLIAFKQNC